MTCNLGRPLTVSGSRRVAPVIPCANWCNADAQDVVISYDELPLAQRQAIGADWSAAAAGEHASIASFSRFIFHLLAHAAPPDLLQEATAALSDEIRHAQLAFDLASRYLGRSAGPGELDISQALVPVSKHELIAALIEEACVGDW